MLLKCCPFEPLDKNQGSNYENYWEIPNEKQNADFDDSGDVASIHKPFRTRTKQQTRRIIQ